VQTRIALFKLVKHHAVNLSFYYDVGASGGFSSSRLEMNSNSKISIQCYRCKGNHRMKDCKESNKYEGIQRSNSFISSHQSAKKFPARNYDGRNKNAEERKTDVGSNAGGMDRSTKTKYSLRENPKKTEKSVPFEDRGSRKSFSGNGKVKKVGQPATATSPDTKIVGQQTTGSSTEGYSGMATVEGALTVPYQLDSGADHSIIYQWMVNTLHERAFIGIETLKDPIQVVLGDGSQQTVTQVAEFHVILQTEAGAVTIPRVKFRILPGGCEEILIGRSELDQLKVPTLEASLAARVKEERGNSNEKQLENQQESQIRVVDWMEQPAKGAASECEKDVGTAMMVEKKPCVEKDDPEATALVKVEEVEAAVQPTVADIVEEVEAEVQPKMERVKVIHEKRTVRPQQPPQIIYMDDVTYVREIPGRRRARRVWDMRAPRGGRARPRPRIRGNGVRYEPDYREGGRQRQLVHQRSAIGEALAACAESGIWLTKLKLGPAYHNAMLEMRNTQGAGAAGGGRPPGRHPNTGRRARKKKQLQCWSCGGVGHGWRTCRRDGAASSEPQVTVKQGDREDFPTPRAETKCGEIGEERRVGQRAGAAAYEPRAAPTQRDRDGYPATREEARELRGATDLLDERKRLREEERHGAETRPPGIAAERQIEICCEGCGGPHRLLECPTTTTNMKERIWAIKAALDGKPVPRQRDNWRSRTITSSDLERYGLRPREICAACFGLHAVAQCPIPGRGIQNAANWSGTGCFGCGGDHIPHSCSRVKNAVKDKRWRRIFRRMWCYGCGERHTLRACTSLSPTEKDRAWTAATDQFLLMQKDPFRLKQWGTNRIEVGGM
jgi:hypothetical protein